MLKVYKKLLRYVPKQRYLAYVAMVLTTVSTVLTVGAYYYLYEFLKKLVVYQDIGVSGYYAGLVVGLLIASSLIYIISVLLTHVLGFRLETNLRKRGIDGLTEASFRFFDLNSSGKTRRIIDDNAEQTHTIVAHLIPDNSGALLTPVLTIILGFIVDIRVGIALLLLSALAIVLIVGMGGNQNFMKIYQEALERLSSETVEYVRGMQVVKIFGASVTSFKALHEAILHYSKYALDYSMSCKRPYVWFQLVFTGFAAILVPFLILFADIHTAPELTAVKLIMAMFLGGVLFVSFMKVMYVSMYGFMGTAAVEKLEELFESMHQDKLVFGDKEKFQSFDIEFDNVSFGYTKDMILDHISFKLEANKSYALVGESGSGKSTIAKLISGFYKLDGGTIKIGGIPLEQYSEEAIMKNIAFVFQDAKMFHKSLYENVSIGREGASREEVMKAFHLAGCDDILNKFKEKENTVIGSKGVYLSGGEKQRIAIARAILKNANIIILDEASAAVDPENEHELQKAFSNLMEGKTVIMIAHRLTSIRSVDEILVMENGKIIERGSDRTLMSKDSRYREFQDLYGKANEWRVRYEEAI